MIISRKARTRKIVLCYRLVWGIQPDSGVLTIWQKVPLGFLKNNGKRLTRLSQNFNSCYELNPKEVSTRVGLKLRNFRLNGNYLAYLVRHNYTTMEVPRLRQLQTLCHTLEFLFDTRMWGLLFSYQLSSSIKQVEDTNFGNRISFLK